MQHLAVYVSPGWTDFRSVKTEIAAALQPVGVRCRIAAKTYLLGSGGQQFIYDYCVKQGIPFELLRSVPALNFTRLVIKPFAFLAFEREEGVVSRYARELANFKTARVILKQSLGL